MTKQRIWRDPGIVEKLDFVGGPGGRSQAPKPPFHFLREENRGTSPKIRVTDSTGREWVIKWGSEVKAETFASRVAWAAGYFVEPTYYLARGKVHGVTGLGRAKSRVAPDGSFTAARFELRDTNLKPEKQHNWAWSNNPFAGTREFNGLKIIMMLTSNWDNKDASDADGANTAIFRCSMNGHPELRYAVTDWGGSMGKWGDVTVRNKWDCTGFAEQTAQFIRSVAPDGMIRWGYGGQHTSDFVEGVSVADVKWLLRYVGRITDSQIRAGLRASGATPQEVHCFARAFRARINQMKRLSAR